MDIPAPLLERLKRHLALPSADTYPRRQEQFPRGRLEHHTDSKQSNAPAEVRVSPSETGPAGGASSSNSWSTRGCNADSSATPTKTRCRKPVSSSEKSRSHVKNIKRSNVNRARSGSSTSGVSNTVSLIECNDGGRTGSDNLGSTSWSNTRSTVSDNGGSVKRKGATGLNATDCVWQGGESTRKDGSHTRGVEDSRNTREIRNIKAGLLSDSTAPQIRPAEENRREDTAQATAGRATLSVRCAWSSSLHIFGDTRWVCNGLYANEGFHCVYLLRSLQTPRCTYIGYSVNPLHRLRQHNGDVSHGGAWKTRRHRPWALVLVVYGFPHAVAALQFEWRWQRTVPAPVTKRAGEFHHQPVAAAGAAATRTGEYGRNDCFEVRPTSGLARKGSKRRRLTGDVSGSGSSSQGFSGKPQETRTRSETSALQRTVGLASPPRTFDKRSGFDRRTQPASCSTSSAVFSGSTLSPEMDSVAENGVRRGGVRGSALNGHQGTSAESIQLSFVNVDAWEETKSLNDPAELLRKCSRSPHRTCTARPKAASATRSLTASVASTVGAINPVQRHDPYTQQRSLYCLSRTGNGIVARVGLRLQTLLALLHTEPFKHMPLAVHVVDAYTAAPYFRLLLRERKAAGVQRAHRRGDVTLHCAPPTRKNQAHTRRQPAWMLLERSLPVSFGDAALLLPLVRRLAAGGRTTGRKEDSWSKSNVIDVHGRTNAGSNEESGGFSGNGSSDSQSCNNSSFLSSGGMSGSAVEVVEVDPVAYQCESRTTDSKGAPLSDGPSVSATWSMPGDSARSLNDCVPFTDLPWCRLCGHAFLEEPRERPASRCGRCMCLSHLTCLARSTLGMKLPVSSRAKRDAAQDKWDTGSRANDSPTGKGENPGGEDTGGSGASEGCPPSRSCSGLVPLEVKCVCCGLVRSWAEVLADGVVLSCSTVKT